MPPFDAVLHSLRRVSGKNEFRVHTFRYDRPESIEDGLQIKESVLRSISEKVPLLREPEAGSSGIHRPGLECPEIRTVANMVDRFSRHSEIHRASCEPVADNRRRVGPGSKMLFKPGLDTCKERPVPPRSPHAMMPPRPHQSIQSIARGVPCRFFNARPGNIVPGLVSNRWTTSNASPWSRSHVFRRQAPTGSHPDLRVPNVRSGDSTIRTPLTTDSLKRHFSVFAVTIKRDFVAPPDQAFGNDFRPVGGTPQAVVNDDQDTHGLPTNLDEEKIELKRLFLNQLPLK